MEPYDLLDRLYLASFFPVYSGTDRAGGDRPVRILNLQESTFASNLAGVWKPVIQPLHLNHRHVVSTYPPYEPKGWIVTERVAGHLGATLQTSLEPDQARTLLRQMLDALEQYHASGLIHGGVCPEAFLIDEKRFAKLDYSPGLLINGEVLQRIAHHEFTPPETINPALGQIGFQADLYSLGMSLAALLIGQDFKNYFPIDEQSPETIRVSWMSWHARPDESLESVGVLAKIPVALRPILAAMTAKQVARRPASTSEISMLLKKVPDVLIDLPPEPPTGDQPASASVKRDQVDNSLARKPALDKSNLASADKAKANKVLLPAVVVAGLVLLLGSLVWMRYSLGGNRPPIANPDKLQVTEAGAISLVDSRVEGEVNLLENDTDDAKTVSFEVVGVQHGNRSQSLGNVSQAVAGDYGTLVVDTDGSCRYTLDDSEPAVNSLSEGEETLRDVFSYTIRDRQGETSTTQLVVTIKGANDVPVPVADAALATEAGGNTNSVSSALASGNVLANDTDPDSGDGLVVIGIQKGEQALKQEGVSNAVAGDFGSVVVNADGSFTYRIDENNPAVESLIPKSEKKIDIFSYSITDKRGLVSSAQITISIEGASDAPVAAADSATATLEDGKSDAGEILSEGNLLINDSDVDANDVLAVVAVQLGSLPAPNAELPAQVQGKFGTLTLKSDGRYAYSIASKNESVKNLWLGDQPLTDQFTYTIRDSWGLESSSQLTVKIESKRRKLKYFALLSPKLRTTLSVERAGEQVIPEENGRVEVRLGDRIKISGPGYKSEELVLPDNLDPEIPWAITPTAELPEGYKPVPGAAINVETGYPEEIYFDDPKLEADSPLRLRLVGADVDELFDYEIGVANPERPGEELPLRREGLTRPFYVSTREMTNYQVSRLAFLKDQVSVPPENKDFYLSPVRNTVFKAAAGRCEELFGGRLPTEAEWELAARGAKQKAYPYPWGKGQKRVSLYATQRDDADALSRELRDQAQLSEDVSPYGLRNLLDSLSEWCVTEDGKPVIRGCSINDDVPRTATLESRPEIRITRRRAGDDIDSGDWIGYRLVLDTKLEFRRKREGSGNSSQSD
jgi:VCBS repeat-containing protein